jgi:hypothetical protein
MGRPAVSSHHKRGSLGVDPDKRTKTVQMLLGAWSVEKDFFNHYARLESRSKSNASSKMVVSETNDAEYSQLRYHVLPMFEEFGRQLLRQRMSDYVISIALTFSPVGLPEPVRKRQAQRASSAEVAANLGHWRNSLEDMRKLRKGLGLVLRWDIEKKLKLAIKQLKQAEEGFAYHHKVLKEWADTLNSADQVIAKVDELKEIKAYHDRAKTVVAFFKAPFDTIVDEVKDKGKGAYMDKMGGGKDKWDVIKAGIANLGRYYATIDFARRGYKSPTDILNKLNASGQYMETIQKNINRLARDLRAASTLETTNNVALIFVEIH